MSRQTKAETRKLRILIVEDRSDVAKTTAMLFRVSGFEVQIALNGTSALSHAETFSPDVALLDLGLPDMDGCEVARRIRANPKTSCMRLIAVTGRGEEFSEMVTEAGFDRHLTKPVEPEMLISLLDDIQELMQDDENQDSELESDLLTEADPGSVEQIEQNLREPLNLLRVNLALLKEARLDEKRFNELCHSLETEAKNVTELVEKLLVLARAQPKEASLFTS